MFIECKHIYKYNITHDNDRLKQHCYKIYVGNCSRRKINYVKIILIVLF